MVRRYYDKTEDTGTGNPFRSHRGFLGDALIRRTGGADVPVRELPPLLRALLVMDGTVTKTLEAYFWEPVEVATLRQEFIHAEHPIPWIRTAPGDRVLVRRARLSGVESKRAYAAAFSVIRTHLMPEAFKLRLIDRRIGIGVLIRDSGLESYREVLEIGIEPADESGDSTAPATSELVFRTYRILIDGKPVILITEHFPLDLYR